MDMDIFGLSSIDTLVSILLIETGWWGKEFLRDVLELEFSYRHDYRSFDVVGPLLVLLKFLGQAILWSALMWNRPGSHSVVLNTWYWVTTVVLDLINISWIVVHIPMRIEYLPAVLSAALCILTRGWIWIIGKRVIDELSSSAEESAFFHSGFIAHVTDRSRVQATLTTLLVWEFLFYTLSLVGTVIYVFFIQVAVLLPFNENPGSLSWWILLVMPVLVALFQLIGVNQDWRGFLKYWFAVYILFNVIGYILFNTKELFNSFEYNSVTPQVSTLTLVICQVTLPLCGLGLKLGITIASYVFVFKTDQVPEQRVTDERKPLIVPKIK